MHNNSKDVEMWTYQTATREVSTNHAATKGSRWHWYAGLDTEAKDKDP